MKFEKGDRIAFYRAGQSRKKGVVESVGMLPLYLIVIEDDGTPRRLHPKQCRKLKPKTVIHYQHDVTVYVPCYQDDTNPSYPTFRYNFAEATVDEQMCLSLKPDYVLVLKGEFDAKTK